MINETSFVKYVSDVPAEFVKILKQESSTITQASTADESRIFFKSRTKSYKVSKYSHPRLSIIPPLDVLNILHWVLSLFPGYTIFWANIFSMTPGQRYPVHSDGREFHYYSRRFHIPITYSTDSYHVHFVNSNNSWNAVHSYLEVGKMYEFDNITPHSAINNSLEMRHVFVVDLMTVDLFETRKNWLDVRLETGMLTHKADLEFSKDERLKFWCFSEISKNAQF